MIVEFENKPMTNLIPLKAIHIEPEKPNIQNKYGNTSPSRKVSRENTCILNTEVLIYDNEY